MKMEKKRYKFNTNLIHILTKNEISNDLFTYKSQIGVNI